MGGVSGKIEGRIEWKDLVGRLSGRIGWED